LKSRKDVLCALSLGVTERATPEICFYIRRRLEPAPSGAREYRRFFDLDTCKFRKPSTEMKAMSAEMKAMSAEMKAMSAEMKAISAEMKAISAEMKAISAEMKAIPRPAEFAIRQRRV
jgi:hypothetical protein